MSTTLTSYLQLLIKQGGSDLHLAAGQPPLVRIVGELVRVDVPPLKAEELEKILSDILSPQQKMDLKTNRQLDFSLKVTGLGVFRGNIFYQMKGLSAAFRALPEVIPSIDQLQLPAICRTASNYANGLVLVTGPTGSGKSTTLAAMIGHINQTGRRHILTLEDPVEFRHESARSLVNQRQLGTHFNDFASALKASLREDPDVILVGEMRDPETMALAITAAETGHLVFATLHTNSAAKSIDRILDSFDSSRQSQMRAMLSESLRLVISQKLIPTATMKVGSPGTELEFAL